jgi:hypothetical protein
MAMAPWNYQNGKSERVFKIREAQRRIEAMLAMNLEWSLRFK